ncbi:centromere protein X isoform X4 [Cricetulus griseus]|uniref:Centromere protein X n=1 Tax=Cricetulus griseus TaxID=10029 RepID=A0A9J7JNS0_CRIGR|nr:centromere protein X isoform X4 [Cricetulus griseus]XP_027281170.1 centromere protein X isoform X4 [Cricetulus griseus]
MWESSGERALRLWPWRKPAASGSPMTSFPSIWEEALRWHCLFGGWVPVGNGTDSLPFLQELVSKLLHLHFRDCKTKVSGDALQLMAELLRIFVLAPGLLEVIPVACKVQDEFNQH